MVNFQAVKAVNEVHDHIPPSVTHQPVTSSSAVVTSATPILTTSVAGSLPSSAMPKVKPIQKQQKLPAMTTVVTATAAQHPPPSVTSSQSQVATLTKHKPRINHHNSTNGGHIVPNGNSPPPLNDSDDFLLATTVPLTKTDSSASNSTITARGGRLPLHDGPVQQHTDMAKQLMQVIHQEKENQQSSERQLMTLSMTMSTVSAPEQHSSWPELLSQDEQRATPLLVQEQHNAALPTLSTTRLPNVPASKSPYATQALPTANTVTHMPSTAVKVAKAPPSFFTITTTPPTTGQATPTTKVAQATVATIRTPTVVTASVVQATPSNKTAGSQATPTNKTLSISTIPSQATPTISKAFQATPTTKALSTVGNQATPTTKAFSMLATGSTSRPLPNQYQTFSVPTSAIKTSGYASGTLAPPTSIVAGASPNVTTSSVSPTGLKFEMPLVQLPKPPLQLFQDRENAYFFEQYGRMVGDNHNNVLCFY